MDGINERIKAVRKDQILTLERFGEYIGLKKNSLSQIENGKNAVSEQVILLICKVFNVDEAWLRTGTGHMYKEYGSELCEIIEKYNLNDTEIKIIRAYLNLPEDARGAIFDFIKSVATETDSSTKEEKKKIYETEDA